MNCTIHKKNLLEIIEIHFLPLCCAECKSIANISSYAYKNIKQCNMKITLHIQTCLKIYIPPLQQPPPPPPLIPADAAEDVMAPVVGSSSQSPQPNTIIDKIDSVTTIIKSITMIPDVPIAALPSPENSCKLDSLTICIMQLLLVSPKHYCVSLRVF